MSDLARTEIGHLHPSSRITTCAHPKPNPAELIDDLRAVLVALMPLNGSHVPLRVQVSQSRTKVVIVLDQLLVVDKKCLSKKIGDVTAKTVAAALEVLQEIVAK